jgi:hypothetical protein
LSLDYHLSSSFRLIFYPIENFLEEESMKKYCRGLFIFAILCLIAGTVSASTSFIDNSAVYQPWTDQLFFNARDGVVNISTAFVGEYQIPILSYNRMGQSVIFMAFNARNGAYCGPDNDWSCFSIIISNLIPGTVSNIANFQSADMHTMFWAYASTNNSIYVVFNERMNDMTYIDAGTTPLLEINKFGNSLIGTPSLQIDSEGHYRLAVTILGGGDLYLHSLVYLYYVGGSNTSCVSSGSPYQCDVIDSSFGNGSMGAPSLDIAGNGTVGISYYKAGDGNGIMYAYPHTTFPGWPSNCGPGGDTWRCISVQPPVPSYTLGNAVKLAMGQDSSQRDIAFTLKQVSFFELIVADYVGSGGDCGWDLGPLGVGAYRWICEIVTSYEYQSTWSFSLDIDPMGFPVIAYDRASSDLANRDLYISYPLARIGDPSPYWTYQRIDGATVLDVDTGAQAAISFRDDGIGFIAYMQEEPYEEDDMKIAYQLYRATLPIVSKP